MKDVFESCLHETPNIRKNITNGKGQIVLMQKGIKFRIYPNREQKNLINQTLGCCRLIYNKGLAMRNEAYKTGNKISYSQTSAMLTDLKKQEHFAFFESSGFHCIAAVSA